MKKSGHGSLHGPDNMVTASAPSPEKKGGKKVLREIRITPAENGYTVNTRHSSSDKEYYDSQSKEHVFQNKAAMIKHIDESCD